MGILPRRGVSEEIRRRTCAVGHQHTPGRSGVGAGGVVLLREAGHTFEESPLVQRVQSALPRVWSAAGRKMPLRLRVKRRLMKSYALHAFVSLLLYLVLIFCFLIPTRILYMRTFSQIGTINFFSQSNTKFLSLFKDNIAL